MATTGIAQNKIKRFETASDLAGARAGVPGWGCRLGKGAKKKKGGWGKKKFFGYPEPQDRMRVNLLLSCTRVVHLPLIFRPFRISAQFLLCETAQSEAQWANSLLSKVAENMRAAKKLDGGPLVQTLGYQKPGRFRTVVGDVVSLCPCSLLLGSGSKDSQAIFKERFADVLLEREPT
jgi:hypothetical protein